MISKRFGRLVVKNLHGTDNHRKKLWTCECDCGTLRVIRASDLRSGRTRSCGCYHKEMSSQANLTHGLSKFRIYGIWKAMRKRCGSPNNVDYKYYGGRGIRVCDEWLSSFLAFYNWSINNGYDDILTIDRIDVNGNYEPGNCKWSTHLEQIQNRRSTKFTESKIRDIRSDNRTLKEIAKDHNVSPSMIGYIKRRQVWTNVVD